MVCYTEPDTARGDGDYLSLERDSPHSEIVFGVNQSVAECVVRLVNDQEFETRERFFVRLAPSSTHGFVNVDPSSSSICVYINYAEDDSKPAPSAS